MTIQIGYAESTITPSLDRPVYLAGFGQNRPAASIHDDLYVRALAMKKDGVWVIWVALDLIGLGRHHCLKLEQQIQKQTEAVQVIIACTHTHHGPDTIGLWGPNQGQSGVDKEYMANLMEKIVATSVVAWQKRQPADLRTTSVIVTGVAKNARDPDILDEELTCLQFCELNTGLPLVSWLIYPCHPEVLWDGNTSITSDYIYAMRQQVEAETNAPCLAMVGSLGGMMTPDMNGNTFLEAKRMGQILARAALDSLAETEPGPVNSLAHRRYEYETPMENPLLEMAIGAGLIPDFLNEDGTVTSEGNLLMLDDTWLFAVPGELLPTLGLAYKSEMKRLGGDNAAVIGLANDELGYILPAEDFVYPENPFEPGDHYEETMSIGIEAGPRLTAAFQTLLTAEIGNDYK